MTITRAELEQALQSLADSLDEHIGTAEAATAIRALADRIETEGLEKVLVKEPEFTPDSPRYPEVEVVLTGEDGSILSIVTRVSQALRRHGVKPSVIDDFHQAVTSKKYDQGLYEVTCWVTAS